MHSCVRKSHVRKVVSYPFGRHMGSATPDDWMFDPLLRLQHRLAEVTGIPLNAVLPDFGLGYRGKRIAVRRRHPGMEFGSGVLRGLYLKMQRASGERVCLRLGRQVGATEPRLFLPTHAKLKCQNAHKQLAGYA
jgi:hypothetical protein